MSISTALPRLSPIAAVSRLLPRGRAVSLLGSLLALIAIGPWLDEQRLGLIIWEILFTVVMLGAIHNLSGNRGQAIVGALLALPTMACLWLRELVPVVGLSQIGLGLLVLFLLYTAAIVLRAVLRAERVTGRILSDASSVYLLMGLAWGCFYSLIDLQTPGAFHLPTLATPAPRNGLVVDVPFNILVYFSFTTLTTVGYGDVVPVAPLARTAAMLEAVLGSLYLTILIARLVGLHTVHARPPS